MNILRYLYQILSKKLINGKVIILLGARRVGKTMLVNKLLHNLTGKILFLNGEDYETQQLLEKRSAANYKKLLAGYDCLFIDEAQNINEVGKVLKLIVDEIPKLKILATGSSAFDLSNKLGEPLTGRSFEYILYPISQLELQATENFIQTKQELESRLIYGCYPEVITTEGFNDKETYLKGIVQSYLLKDIISYDGIKNSRKIADLLRLLAYQIGSIVSLNEIATQIGLSRNTVEKYIDLLIKTFVIIELKAYSTNLRKEISKSSKYYFVDIGIRNALINNFSAINLRNDIGALWENYLIIERIKYCSYKGSNINHYYWRTTDQQEVDYIEEKNGTIKGYEFKWGNNKKISLGFKTRYPNAETAIINLDNYLEFVS